MAENFFFDRGLGESDPAVAELCRLEEARQDEKIIMIASESICPRPVREALASRFGNIYAEGYPSRRMTRDRRDWLDRNDLLMSYHRRYGDRRYYKGAEMADFVEALAARRAAELFATERVRASEIYANVQPLSGAAANNAVYEAFARPGQTVMGMALACGGHLTHGSPVNRSGRNYRILPYEVDPATGRFDFEKMRRDAAREKPRIVIAGASAFPWDIDWPQMRTVADAAGDGCVLLADVSHPAGLIAAGEFSSPIGYADVVTFTTHKTLCGPRGAAILSTDPRKALMIDAAVFPGEQGGPHVNQIAAKAVCFALARTPEFRELQRRIVANCRRLADELLARGLRLAYGGTASHLCLVDLKGLEIDPPLSGEIASRILDIIGITCNKNTLPGDGNAAHPSGLRLGTTWITQRGATGDAVARLAGVIDRALRGIRTFDYRRPGGAVAGRGKIDFGAMMELREETRRIKDSLACAGPSAGKTAGGSGGAVEISGERDRVRGFLQGALGADIASMGDNEPAGALILDERGKVVSTAALMRTQSGEEEKYLVALPKEKSGAALEWLRALSDGYVVADPEDVYLKVEGPALMTPLDSVPRALAQKLASVKAQTPSPAAAKLFFVGMGRVQAGGSGALPAFEASGCRGEARKTPLYEKHAALAPKSGIVPFAGWMLPVWYESISAEHAAVRSAAGLFDVSHMGVIGISGPDAARYLDIVGTNYASGLLPGRSAYSFLLAPDGAPIDDILIYRRGPEEFMVVVNAANAEKDLAWMKAVNDRRVRIDPDRPNLTIDCKVAIRDLKEGAGRRVDIALQGPASTRTILGMADEGGRDAIRNLSRGEFVDAPLAGIPVMVSRTGYTGEEFGYEMYLDPAEAPALWDKLLAAGREFGVRAAGLGARDSTRTEAGFPLYGHELAGEDDISPEEAGYGAFVKLHKPYFIGRRAYIKRMESRTMEVARFRVESSGARAIRPRDPVATRRGEFAGRVTSCALVGGVQIGMALVDRRSAAPGTRLAIYPLPRKGPAPQEPPRDKAAVGDKTIVPEEAVVIERFMALGARPAAGEEREQEPE